MIIIIIVIVIVIVIRVGVRVGDDVDTMFFTLITIILSLDLTQINFEYEMIGIYGNTIVLCKEFSGKKKTQLLQRLEKKL